MPMLLTVVLASARTEALVAPRPASTARPYPDTVGPRWGVLLYLTVAVAAASTGLGAALGAVLVLAVGRGAVLPGWFAAVVAGTNLTVAGAAYLRGRGGIGVLLLGVGAAWLVAWLVPAEGLLAAAPLGFTVHLLLAWPDGRLRGLPERMMVGAAHAVALVLLPLGLRWGWSVPVAGIALVAAVGVLALLIGRFLAATRPGRRLLWPGGVAVAVIVAGVATTFCRLPLAVALQGAATLVPLIHLAGFMRDRVRRTAVTELVRRLPHTRPEQVPNLLRAALRDPSLRIVRSTPDGDLIDGSGHPLDAGAAARTELPRVGRQHMVLLHDPALCAERHVLDAVAAAAALALDNQLLAAEVRAQLEEVRASRARVVAAADEGRRRIERDLHDGVQQHLVTVSLVLRMARDRLLADPEPEAVDALLDRVADGLDAALLELRELARGIHPAVLTEAGLIPALHAMAARSVQSVDVVGPDTAEIALDPDAALPPLPAPIAATAYFVAAEAVTNAAKHAGAQRVHVQVRRTAERLLVTVVDDGAGGAAPGRGTGLAGLRDRVAAVGGELTVHSPPGAGTTVHADLPLTMPLELP
jgi:signal transduction histidine kinase